MSDTPMDDVTTSDAPRSVSPRSDAPRSELPDLELDSRSPAGPEPPRRGGPPVWLLAAVLVVAVVAVGVWYLFWRKPSAPPIEPPETVAPVVRPEPERAEPPEEEIELPPLAASDDVVRRLVEGLSSHPRLASWLATDELIQKFVATVDNIAEGTSPRSHLGTVAPRSPFPAIDENGHVVADPEGYRRYDSVVAAFTGIDPQGAVHLYRQLQPLIDEAYRQLGYPDTDFDRTLERAIVALLEVPVVEGEVRLVPQVRSYKYADPRLEGLTDAQKHLLRTGPDNVRRVQAQLRVIARELGIPEEMLPNRRVIRAGEGG